MKKLLTVLIVIAIIIGLWVILNNSKDNNAEPPTTATPTPVFNIGFDSIKTDSHLVWRLLDQDLAEGLRFYNASSDPRAQRSGIIMVAVNSDGVELNDENDIGYIYLDGSGAHQSLSHAEAKQFAEYVNRNPDITNMISEISKTDSLRGFDRMTISPEVFREIDNRDTTYYPTVELLIYAYSSPLSRIGELRTHPCPPVCAQSWMYLYNPESAQAPDDNDEENGGEEEEDEGNGQGEGDRY